MTLPIFNGGIIQSQVRQAESVSRQYRLLLSQTRRVGEQEIHTFFDALVADRLRFLKLKELVQISKKNYETQTDYYRHGLVTNLDVLQAITTYQDSQRQLDHQKQTVRMDLVKLQAAVGERSEIKIEPNTDVTTNISIINTNGLP
jgi:outer membrane protein